MLLLLTFAAGRASAKVETARNQIPQTINEVQPGMTEANVSKGLSKQYSLERSESEGIIHYLVTEKASTDQYYEVNFLDGVVASVWWHESKDLAGDANLLSRKLFEAIYAEAQPSKQPSKAELALGVRRINLRIYFQKMSLEDQDERDMIFELPDRDYRIRLLTPVNGSSHVEISRVRSQM